MYGHALCSPPNSRGPARLLLPGARRNARRRSVASDYILHGFASKSNLWVINNAVEMIKQSEVVPSNKVAAVHPLVRGYQVHCSDFGASCSAGVFALQVPADEIVRISQGKPSLELGIDFLLVREAMNLMVKS
jgi:hypothetical protein